MPIQELEQSALAPTLQADHPEVSLHSKIACPDCGKEMRRFPYCGSSTIIIDSCPGHGLWLDDGELSAIVTYVKECGEALGGLEDLRNFTPVRPVGVLQALSRMFRGS